MPAADVGTAAAAAGPQWRGRSAVSDEVRCGKECVERAECASRGKKWSARSVRLVGSSASWEVVATFINSILLCIFGSIVRIPFSL